MAIVKCPQCGKPISNKARKCPHCGFVLQSVTELRKLKHFLIPVISVCVVAILAILFYLYSKDTSSSTHSDHNDQNEVIVEEHEEESTPIVKDVRTIETDDKDTLTIVTIVEEVVMEDSVEQLQPKVEQRLEESAKPKVSKLDLGYATYEPMEGALGIKNGKPNGNGIMSFKSRQTIPGTVDCVAEPGEWVNGMWRDGKVNVGTWYRNDGNQVIVKLGQRNNK